MITRSRCTPNNEEKCNNPKKRSGFSMGSENICLDYLDFENIKEGINFEHAILKYFILACRPSAGNLGASGATPPSSRLQLALRASTQAGAPEPGKRILALFGTFWPFFLLIFFLSQIVISPYSNIF